MPEGAIPQGSEPDVAENEDDVPTSARESLELLRSYYSIEDSELRRAIRHMVKSIEKRLVAEA